MHVPMVMCAKVVHGAAMERDERLVHAQLGHDGRVVRDGQSAQRWACDGNRCGTDVIQQLECAQRC